MREFLRDLRQKYRQDHVSILVSSLAYWTFFSFFPMLLLLASVIGFLHGREEGHAGLSRRILELLPFSSEYMANAVERIIRARRSLGFFGSVLLIWSATAAFDVVQQILNRIHRAPAMRPLWRRRLLGLLLGLIVLLFLPLSVGVSAVPPLLARALEIHTRLSAAWQLPILTICSGALGIAFNFALLLTLYRFGPSVRRRVRDTWPGALAAAVLWEASKVLFGVYLGTLSSYKMLYGSIGSVIAVLLWLYVSGTLFAHGAEINYVLGARRGS